MIHRASRCAHCNQAVYGPLEVFQVLFQQDQLTFIRALVDADGKPVHYDRLIALLYSGRDLANPMNSLHVLQVTISRRLIRTDYRVATTPCFGYRLVKKPVFKDDHVWTKLNIQGRKRK